MTYAARHIETTVIPSYDSDNLVPDDLFPIISCTIKDQAGWSSLGVFGHD